MYVRSSNARLLVRCVLLALASIPVIASAAAHVRIHDDPKANHPRFKIRKLHENPVAEQANRARLADNKRKAVDLANKQKGAN